MSTAIYTNSAGVSFNLLDFSGMKLKTAKFHSFKWNANATAFKYGDLLKGFTKDAVEYEAEFKVFGSESERIEKLNDFHDATEHDIFLQTPGTLTIDGYYIECYITMSETEAPEDQRLSTTNIITFYCPYPFWLKETKYSLSMSGSALIDAANFPLNLPLNLGVSGFKRTITVDSSIPYEFRLEINGAITNPSLTINGHIYEVGVTVPTNATLVISSIERRNIEKCIYLSYPSGNTVNVFNKRNKDSYIFEPITGPTIIISSAQEITFDLYLIERRSEPKWI